MDLPLLLIKSLVRNVPESPVTVSKELDRITATGETSNCKFSIVFKKELIQISKTNLETEHESYYVYRKNTDMPQIFWSLWHNYVPVWSEKAFKICPLIIGFYVTRFNIYNNWYGNYTATVHGHSVYWRCGSDMSPELYIDHTEYLWFGRLLFAGAVRWRHYLFRRVFNEVLTDLKYVPGRGVHFMEAARDFSSQLPALGLGSVPSD